MIHELLGIGKKEAMSAAELSRITGLTPRGIRAQITRERLSGKLICSSARARGYYKPETDADLVEFAGNEHSRARTATQIERRFRAELARRNPAQMRFTDTDGDGDGE